MPAIERCPLYSMSAKGRYDKKVVVLHRDDGLAVFKNISGSEAETIKKNFKNDGLEIVIWW